MRDDIPSSELSQWNARYDKVYRQVSIELSKSPMAQVD